MERGYSNFLAVAFRGALCVSVCAIVTSCAATTSSSGKATSSERVVLLMDSEEAQERTKSFAIQPADARKLAVKASHRLKEEYGVVDFAGSVQFIAGRWYCFGMSSKTAIYFGGFYVHGDSGAVEYRESDKRAERFSLFRMGRTEIPENAYTKIIPLLPGKK